MISDGCLRGYQNVTLPVNILWETPLFPVCTAILMNTYITLPLGRIQHSIKSFLAVRLLLPKRITLTIPFLLQ